MNEKSILQPVVEMKIIEKGPVIVHGPVKVITPDGIVVMREMCAICR